MDLSPGAMAHLRLIASRRSDVLAEGTTSVDLLEVWLNPDDELASNSRIYGLKVCRTIAVPRGGVRIFDRRRLVYR